MFCTKCGKQIEDGVRFCGYCGAKMTETELAPADVPALERQAETFQAGEPEVVPAEQFSADTPEDGQTDGDLAQAAAGGEQTPPRADEATAGRRMTFCKECGTPIEEGQPFCRICGAETQWCGNYAAPPPASSVPEVPPARKVIAEHRAINVIMSVLLSIFLFVFTLSSLAIALVKPSLNKVDFKEILSDADLTAIEISIDGEKTNLTDYVYDLCNESAPRLHLTREAVEEVLNKDFIKDFAGEVIDEYRAYLLGDDSTDGLTKDRVLDFVRKNEKKILQILEDNDIENAEIDYDGLEKQLDENFAGLDLKSDIGSEIFGAASAVVNRVLPAIAVVFAALAGLFLLLLIVLNVSHITAMLNHIGIPVLLAGLTGLAGCIALHLMVKKIEASDPLALAAKNLTDASSLQLMLGGIILLAAGILMTVAAMVTHHVLKKRRQLN